MSSQQKRPNLDLKTAKKFMENLYGLRAKSLEELDSYEDRNYRVLCEKKFENPHIERVNKSGYVLKIMNSMISKTPEIIEIQTNAMILLSQNGIECSIPIKQKNGSYFSLESWDGKEGAKKKQKTESEDEKKDSGYEEPKKYAVRLLEYKEGIILAKTPATDQLMFKVGRLTAEIGQKLATFAHPGLENCDLLWSLKSVPKLREFTSVIKNQADYDLVNQVIDAFEEQVFKVTEELEEAVVHGDLNERNIIVDESGNEIKAVIDFGEMHRSYMVFDLAIAMCYMFITARNVRIGKALLKGYQESRRLKRIEKKVLKVCVCGRLCQSLILGLYSHSLDPQNDYVLSSQKNGWKILKELWPMSEAEISRIWEL